MTMKFSGTKFMHELKHEAGVDADLWVDAFLEEFPNGTNDKAALRSWFNAMICRGLDEPEYQRAKESQLQASE